MINVVSQCYWFLLQKLCLKTQFQVIIVYLDDVLFHTIIRDLTNQNATQFENTETEKGPGRERCHEHGKNKVTDANATTEAELRKSFKLH